MNMESLKEIPNKRGLSGWLWEGSVHFRAQGAALREATPADRQSNRDFADDRRAGAASGGAVGDLDLWQYARSGDAASAKAFVV